tara:strand:- start:6026 stop:7315 length:1290 start_codon:yes stop_codon:yes gene_type:complete
MSTFSNFKLFEAVCIRDIDNKLIKSDPVNNNISLHSSNGSNTDVDTLSIKNIMNKSTNVDDGLYICSYDGSTVSPVITIKYNTDYVDLNNKLIKNVANPVDDTDISTKKYVNDELNTLNSNIASEISTTVSNLDTFINNKNFITSSHLINNGIVTRTQVENGSIGNFTRSWEHSTSNYVSLTSHTDISTYLLIWYLTVHYYIMSSNYTTASDIRTKINITKVDPNDALNKIQNIDVYNYDIIDRKQNDIGFIAQEVKNVLPESIDLKKEYVCDINKELNNSSWTSINIDGKELFKIQCEEINDLLETNNKYKFIVSDNNDIINDNKTIEVDINDDLSFTFEKKWNFIYCYGKLADDFHAINQDMIYSLYHSAIQELDDRQINEEKEIEELELELEELENETNTLKTNLNELIDKYESSNSFSEFREKLL